MGRPGTHSFRDRVSRMKNRDALLVVADSEHDANMLYATGLFVPDPFIYFQIGRRRHVVMSDLEIDRAKRDAAVDRVLSLSKYQQALKSKGIPAPRLGDVLPYVLREHGVQSVEVPSNFPIGL